MKLHWLLPAALLLFALGCENSPPAPPAQPAPAAPAAAPPEQAAKEPAAAPPTEPTPQPQPTPPTTTKPAEPAKSEPLTGLRAIAARLVERDPGGGWRVSEAAALEMDKQAAAGEKLLPLLADASIDVRRGAAFYLLGSFNPSDSEHVATFSALLDDSDKTVRGIGLSAVKQMREADIVAAIPRLGGLLDPAREEQPDNRVGIARLLGKLKSQATSAAAALTVAAARDPEAKVRAACLVALSQVAEPSAALPAYRQALSDADASVRLVAAARLRSLGAKAAPAAEELGKTLEDADVRVADAAGETLVAIGQPAIKAILPRLEAKQPTTRKLALACLAKLGPVAAEAAPAAEKLLQDADAEVRKLAEVALQRIRGK